MMQISNTKRPNTVGPFGRGVKKTGKIITHPLDIWIEKSRDKRGLGEEFNS